jgi:hypothetical protein
MYQIRLERPYSVLQQFDLPVAFFDVYLAKNGNKEMQISATLPC